MSQRDAELGAAKAEASLPLISHMIHTCIVCTDFDVSFDFYTRILGAKVAGTVSDGEARELGRAMGTTGVERWHGVLLYWGDRERTSYVDLISYSRPDGDAPAGAERGPADPGLARLALRVPNIDRAVAHIERNGVRMAGPPARLDIEGRPTRVAFFLDPDGTLLEFSERGQRPDARAR